MLLSMSILAPVGIIYGSQWMDSAHIWPFCNDITSSPSYAPMSLENLTRYSQVVVIGTISGVGPAWQAPNTDVFTDITIATSSYLKYSRPGVNGTDLRFQAAGGTIGCYSYTHSGEPRFNRGEQVLLFLQSAPYETLRVTGGPQGKYVITGDTAYWGDPGNAVSLEILLAEIRQFL